MSRHESGAFRQKKFDQIRDEAVVSVEVVIDKSSMCLVDERRDDGMRDEEDEKDKKEEVEREKLRLMVIRANHIRTRVLAWGFNSLNMYCLYSLEPFSYLLFNADSIYMFKLTFVITNSENGSHGTPLYMKQLVAWNAPQVYHSQDA